MLRRLTAAAAVALCLLPAAAARASGDDVIKDCLAHGRLTKKYSQSEYRDALANIPTDVDEYTNCRDVIRHGQLGGGSGAAPPPAADGAAGPVRDPLATASPQERAAATQDIAAAARGGSSQRRLDGAIVTPGALAYHQFSSVSKLPMPLVALAVLVGLAALATGGYLLITRVRAPRSRT
jgi:hypothetical protein